MYAYVYVVAVSRAGAAGKGNRQAVPDSVPAKPPAGWQEVTRHGPVGGQALRPTQTWTRSNPRPLCSQQAILQTMTSEDWQGQVP